MRKFSFIFLGQVLEELNEEIYKIRVEKQGKERADAFPTISRVMYYRKEKELGLPQGVRTLGGWRSYTPSEVEDIKQKIKTYLRLV